MGAGPARERQAELAGRIPETWFFRCPALRIGDAVQWWCLPGPLKPSLGAVSLAVPGQTAPSRHHHCPAHFAAAPPRVSSTLSERRQDLSISKGAPGSGGPVQDRVWPGIAKAVRRPAEPTWMYSWRVLDGPTRSRCGLSGEKSFWHPAGSFAPFRGQGPLPQGPHADPRPRLERTRLGEAHLVIGGVRRARRLRPRW